MALFLTGLVIWRRRMTRRRELERFRALAHAHRDRQLQLIDEFLKCNPAPSDTLAQAVLKSSAKVLVENTISGIWKVETIVLVYCHKAAAAHSQLNCLTEIMFDSALKKAREMDLNPVKVGKLFGVPISIKDNINVKGVASSAGLFSWKEEIISCNSAVVEHLESQGAIPFCKTNVPQTMMSFECRNPLWGKTENFHKIGYSPGGSSGGEAALIAAGGSILGIGSDIAGSLRIPAHFSGVCALKPSNHRIPSSGCRSFRPFPLIIQPVTGPIARNVDDLVLVLESCLGKEGVDNPPSQFHSPQEHENTRKMKFGVIRNIPYLNALPPCTRAVDTVVTNLQAAGYEVVTFDLPFELSKLASLMHRLISADAAHFYRTILKSEPIDESVAPFLKLFSRSKLFLEVYKLIARSYPDSRPFDFLSALGLKNAVDIIQIGEEWASIRTMMDASWQKSGIDALLMPAFPCPASPHGAFPYISFSALYTYIWNIVDYVAGVVPVTRVDPRLDMKDSPTDDNDFNALKSTRLLEAELEYIYDPVKMCGLPVGIQIITPQYHESEAVKAMKIIEATVPAYNEA